MFGIQVTVKVFDCSIQPQLVLGSACLSRNELYMSTQYAYVCFYEQIEPIRRQFLTICYILLTLESAHIKWSHS